MPVHAAKFDVVVVIAQHQSGVGQHLAGGVEAVGEGFDVFEGVEGDAGRPGIGGDLAAERLEPFDDALGLVENHVAGLVRGAERFARLR